MSMKSVLVFTVGAVAGWTVAQLLSGDAEDQLSDAWTSPDLGAPSHAEFRDADHASAPSRPVTTGPDPFRAAFVGAEAEVSSHVLDLDQPDRQVA